MPESQIVSALSRAAAAVGAVGKNERNPQQGFSFRGVDTVVNATSAAFRREQIIVSPHVIEATHEPLQTARGGSLTSVRLVVNFTFTHAPSGETLEATVAAEAFDSGDKATAKAMSVALRTCLLQVLLLPTEEQDPDSFTYEVDHSPLAPIFAQIRELSTRISGEEGREDELAAWITDGQAEKLTDLTEHDARALVEYLHSRLKDVS